jgi:septal ring factor EnvC (AmiA/AmiB activator)
MTINVRAWLLLVCLGMAALTVSATAADGKDTRSQLEQLKAEIGKLQNTLKQFKGERARLSSDLRKSEIEIGTSQKKIRQIEQQLQQQQRELDKLQQQRSELQQAKTQQQAHIADQVRAAYQLGRQNKLKALLNQEQPDQISRTMVYYDYFNRARAEQIDTYMGVIGRLDALEPQIETKAQDLRDAKTELDREYRELVSAKRERERTFAKLNTTIQSKDQQLTQMTRDRNSLEQVLRKLEREALARGLPPSGKPFRELRGQLPWPVAGKPGNRFGAQREDTPLRWQGINISAPEGAIVHAIYSGKVVFADWLRGSGLLIIIDHGGGYMSLYAHNQSLLRSPGDIVKGGDAIATVGNSGGQEHAGLYFEIRNKGVPTDPAAWCRRA